MGKDGISALWLVVIIVAALVLGTVAVVVAMQSGTWFGGPMGLYHRWMHNGNYFMNGTWQNHNDTGSWWCH